ncbi:MAG: glycosyltransferase [Betaproteobacteria bacterium]|nr:glycosyltransferase [Betaproteobacteria bacterium]
MQLLYARNEEELPELSGETFVVQTKLSEPKARRLSSRNALLGFAHLPMHERKPEWLLACTLVATVSEYCISLLRKAGVERLHEEPIYGIAEVARGDASEAVLRSSPYLWDQRKARDRLFSVFYRPTAEKFEKRKGVTLGILSLIVPIKQFPLLFSRIAPVLARHDDVHVEIFGAGGYAQVRDLRKALRPIAARTRFWGYQRNVAAVCGKIDYLLTGLPEKEALGLNVLEAEVCGTPVLAPRGGPFGETIIDGRTGFLYRDPREDAGADFERVLLKAKAGPRPDPRTQTAHLERFGYPALVERAKRLLAALERAAPR